MQCISTQRLVVPVPFVMAMCRYTKSCIILCGAVCQYFGSTAEFSDLMVQEEALAAPARISNPGSSQPSGQQPPGDLLMGADDELPAWAQADTGPQQELTLPLALEDAPPALAADGGTAKQLSCEDLQQQHEGPMLQDMGNKPPACTQGRAHAEPQLGAEQSASQVAASSDTLCPRCHHC